MKTLINEQTWCHYLCKLEYGFLEEHLIGPLYQFMVNSGHVWNFQGFHRREAEYLIEEGIIVFGEKSFKNAYGYSFPSRYEVGDNPGSLEYQKKQGYKYINI